MPTNSRHNKKPKLRYASSQSPTVEAIANNLFRFETIEQAKEKLHSLASKFILSRYKPEDEEEPHSIRLWVKGYALTKKEKGQGYLGNYLLATIQKTKDGSTYTIAGKKQEIALKYHPQRKRPKQKHPDWGHPLLRRVKDKKPKCMFETVEEAQAALQRLHEEHPAISIPLTNKMYIIIYSKLEKEDNNPTKKIILEIKVFEEGGFYIDWEYNTYDAKKAKPLQKESPKGTDETEAQEAESKESKGYFTSMVALKRIRKTPPPASGENTTTSTKEEASSATNHTENSEA